MHRFLLFAIVITLGFADSGFAGGALPKWARGAIWYQILPERYRNINPQNDPERDDVVDKSVRDWQIHPWASDWYKLQKWEAQRDAPFQKILRDRRYGGDLIGVIEKLPYLKDLGVNVLYLTPVFEAPSVEKYDASTLHHIDNNFGLDPKADWKAITSEREDTTAWSMTSADETFFELLAEAHKVDIKVVIEAVFSYCGIGFWAFKDLREKQRNSRYKDWFEVLQWDDPATPDTVEFDYKCWRQNKKLPLFRTDKSGGLAAPVKRYIFDVTRRWMDKNGDGETGDGVDGWAIRDVEGLSGAFWRAWNTLVKAQNADALTVADFTPTGDNAGSLYKFDLYRDNGLADLVMKFFASQGQAMPLSEFIAGLKPYSNLKNKDLRNSRLLQLDGPESDRIATRIVNAWPSARAIASIHGGGYAYNPVAPDPSQLKAQKLLALFQLTFPGAPVIYYGDESGMWGGNYPDNIKPMLWREFVYEKESYKTIRPDLKVRSENRFRQDLFDVYRRLNEARSENPALVKGDFKARVVDDERRVLVYSRTYKMNEVYVLMNLGTEPRTIRYKPEWKRNLRVKDPFREKKYKLKSYEIRLDVAPMSARVLVKEK